MRGREAAPLRRFRSPIGLLVDLVDQLHEDVRARLHRLAIGTFDIDLAIALLEAEMRAL